MGLESLVGATIQDVHSAPSDMRGYYRYFLELSSGEVFEIKSDRIEDSLLPKESQSLAKTFREVLGGPRIRGIRASGEYSAAVHFDTGHLILLFSVFDGSLCSNSLELQSPERASNWKDEFEELWRKIL